MTTRKPVDLEVVKKRKQSKDGSVYVCRCECGGSVRGVFSFGYLWSWCTKCTPVEKVRIGSLNGGKGAA